MKKLLGLWGVGMALVLIGCNERRPLSNAEIYARMVGPREITERERLLRILQQQGVPRDFAWENMCELAATTAMTEPVQAIIIETAVMENIKVGRVVPVLAQAQRDYYMQVNLHRAKMPRMMAGGDEAYMDVNALVLIAVSHGTLKPSPLLKDALVKDVYHNLHMYGLVPGGPALAKSTLAPFGADVRAFLGMRPEQFAVDVPER